MGAAGGACSNVDDSVPASSTFDNTIVLMYHAVTTTTNASGEPVFFSGESVSEGCACACFFFSSLFLSSLELSDTKVYKS